MVSVFVCFVWLIDCVWTFLCPSLCHCCMGPVLFAFALPWNWSHCNHLNVVPQPPEPRGVVEAEVRGLVLVPLGLYCIAVLSSGAIINNLYEECNEQSTICVEWIYEPCATQGRNYCNPTTDEETYRWCSTNNNNTISFHAEGYTDPQTNRKSTIHGQWRYIINII